MWDFKPSAGELLEKRIAAGWTPTATATVDGPKVLGHAACVVVKR